MEKHRFTLLYLLITALFLSSCTTFQSNDQQKAICNELKSKLVWNGNTSNNRTSEFQDAETPMLQRQYDKYHCDQI